MEFTRSELIIYGTIAGIIIGFIIGVILLFLGIKKGKRKLGLIGFFCSIAVGAISGVVSLIIGGVFIWLIFRKSETPPSAEPAAAEENSVETQSEDSENS